MNFKHIGNKKRLNNLIIIRLLLVTEKGLRENLSTHPDRSMCSLESE
jgi:hypothetical protein